MPLLPLAVVIATHDRRPLLERTLDALAGQSVRGFRVVVVDDGSADDTWPWLEERAAGPREPRLAILRQENRGQGQARNLALTRVAEGLVLFLGDDVIPRPDFLAQHLAAHRGRVGDWAVVGFTDWRRSELRVTPLMEMVNREGHQFGYGHMTPGGEVPFTCFYTSNVSLERALLGEEPFDPSFEAYGWEDVELGYRLSRQGLRLVYHPAAAAEHLHPTDLRRFFERQRLVGRGVHTLLRLHPELAGSPHLSPLAPPRWFPLARWLVPPLVPLLSVVDRMGVPLGTKLLHAVLMTGYYLGQGEAE
jgi:GT2 family glycosyltransferase